MKEGIKVFFAGLAVFILAVLIAVAFFFIAGLALYFLAPLSFADVVTGEAAPDFTLTDTYGKSHALSSFKGKFVVLEWLNHECPFVVKHYGSGNMQGLQKDLTAQDVVWLSINSSAAGKEGSTTPEEANKLTAENGAAPTAVLLDGDGKVGKLLS